MLPSDCKVCKESHASSDSPKKSEFWNWHTWKKWKWFRLKMVAALHVYKRCSAFKIVRYYTTCTGLNGILVPRLRFFFFFFFLWKVAGRSKFLFRTTNIRTFLQQLVLRDRGMLFHNVGLPFVGIGDEAFEGPDFTWIVNSSAFAWWPMVSNFCRWEVTFWCTHRDRQSKSFQKTFPRSGKI